VSLGLPLALVLGLRLIGILLLKPGGSLIDSVGDVGFYRELGELTLGGRLPYRDFWVEYPPIFPFVLTGLYRLAIHLPGWPSAIAPFQTLLSLFLLACDAANVLLVRQIARRVYGPEVGNRAALLYALQPFLFLCGLAWFDPFPVTFMLLALDAGLAGRGWLAGAALMLGGLVKVIPLAVAPAVARALTTRRQLARAALGGAVVATLVALPLVALNSPFTSASLVATLNRSSWESIWALLEGYWGVGTVAPAATRLRLETAGLPLHAASLPWTLIGGINLLAVLLLCLVPTDRPEPRRVLAVAGLGLQVTLLLSRGYSPQFLVYQLPLVILIWPDRRGVVRTLILTGLGLLEWPIVMSLFPDRHELIAGVIALRTLFWLWLIAEMVVELLPGKAGRQLGARPRASTMLSRVGAVALAVAVGLLCVRIAQLLPGRGEHVPVVDYVNALSSDGPVVASSRTAFYRLVPLLGRTRAALGIGALESDAGDRVRASSSADYWLVLDHSEGDEEARARLEREMSRLGARATDRWFGYYHLVGFLRAGAWRADPRLVRADKAFGDALTLTGWATNVAELAPGQPVRLVLAWQVRVRPPINYKAFVHLLGPDGEAILAQEDRPLEYLGRGAAGWSVGDSPLTALDAIVPGSAPPGALRLRVGLYDAASGARLAVGGSDHLDLPGPVVRPVEG
jgi:Glycosyltransferase family 87